MSRPNVGIGVFVFRSDTDNRILIGKRKGSHGAGVCFATAEVLQRCLTDPKLGLIAHPGGHLEYGENFESCAAREVMEETGLTIKDVRFLTATTSILTDCNKQFVTIWMAAVNAPEPSESGHIPEPKVRRCMLLIEANCLATNNSHSFLSQGNAKDGLGVHLRKCKGCRRRATNYSARWWI